MKNFAILKNAYNKLSSRGKILVWLGAMIAGILLIECCL